MEKIIGIRPVDQIQNHLIAIQVLRNGIRIWRMLKMNYENCLKTTIKSLLLILRPIEFLSAEDWWGMRMEHLEDVATEVDIDDVLIFSKFKDLEIEVINFISDPIVKNS